MWHLRLDRTALEHRLRKTGFIMVPGTRLTGACVVVAAAILVALSDQVVVASRQAFESRIELVTVTATVTDATGRLVAGLTKDDFEIFDDGARQVVEQFTGDRVPVSLGVLLDVSDSMRGQRMLDARLALNRFLIDLLDAKDEAFIVTFNHAPTVVARWSSPPAPLARQLEFMNPWGGTAIYDALFSSVELFEGRTYQRAAAVLISDGADTASDHTLAATRARLRYSDAFVYALALDVPGRAPESNRVNPYALADLTTENGGYTEVIRATDDLIDATARIADELNHQYTLAYAPGRQPDGKYHSIRVRVRQPDHRVRARRGYIATGRLRAADSR